MTRESRSHVRILIHRTWAIWSLATWKREAMISNIVAPTMLRVSPHFSSGIVERAKRERAWKSPLARNGDTRLIFLSPRRVSPFLAWSDFHARARLAGSTIPEEKWGLLVVYVALVCKRMQQIPTTRNNMQQGVQTDVTCKIQQCREFFANNVAFVCTGL